MVTDDQIDTLHNRVRDVVNEIAKVQNALNLIRLIRPTAGGTVQPKNPVKFTDYTQAEKDAIHADAITELQRIKASL